ncbi:hypothetical protein GGS21DRAFT_510865 [Xylaria nigripes]|nr:hypothetical protein GGS21DRAFT_510865 [Xylaria nigripes]
MGIHCVGALLFSQFLVPQLKAVAATDGVLSCVIWLSTILVDTSAPPNGVGIAILNEGNRARIADFAIAKAGVWILSREFAKRHEADGILSVALNPSSWKPGHLEARHEF